VGSNGKTTTKELARAALAAHYRVHATTGNLNNLVGVPLTLLAAPADAEALVVEVGTNAPGEVARLAAIVEPDAVIVTSIGEEHLEGLGDLEGVLAEETAILPALPPEGVALVADEPAILVERARELAPRVRVAGWGELAEDALRPDRVELDDEGRVVLGWRGGEVTLPLRGRVNARNALLALGLAEAWGIRPADALAALGAARAPAMRSEVHRYGELLVIADCYNANPASVEAAVELLCSMPRRAGRVAVLGTMRELGPASESLHRRLADAVATAGLDLVVATGEFAAAFEPHAAALGSRLIQAEDPIAAYAPLAERLGGGEVILLKGSRGVALERLLPHFEKDFSDPAVAAGETRRAGDGAARATGE
jgi:UDP-N-acetylmuramoyl-tripeptide--D-alanyl-D-alanine ligase